MNKAITKCGGIGAISTGKVVDPLSQGIPILI